MINTNRITEEVIVKIPMEDSSWSVQIFKESNDDMVFIGLFYNNKTTPTHTQAITLDEFDAMYNKIRG